MLRRAHYKTVVTIQQLSCILKRYLKSLNRRAKLVNGVHFIGKALTLSTKVGEIFMDFHL